MREHEIVADAQRLLFELGSEQVEAINAVSGDRCNPHPHVFSDRLLRPGDQAFFDIIHSFMGYRTCYYRTFNVGGVNQSQLDAYKQCREWLDDAIELVRPGVTTDQIAAVWPTAEELGFPDEEACFGLQFGHGLGVGLYEAPMISPPALARPPGRDRGGHGLRAGDLLRRPATGARPRASRRRSSSPPTAAEIITRFPAEELLVTGKATCAAPTCWPTPRRGADVVSEQPTTVSTRHARRAGGRRRDDLELYRRMRLIRRFEDEVQSLFQQGVVHGTTHLYSGQEAGAVGVVQRAGRRGSRRRHLPRPRPRARARRRARRALLAELLGRATGVCARAGRLDERDRPRARLIGCYGIVGGSIAAATGVALALKRRGGVAVAFFGDGATNQGYFHECLNFAKVHELPVVFVCENNLYGEFTPFEQVTAGEIADRAADARPARP